MSKTLVTNPDSSTAEGDGTVVFFREATVGHSANNDLYLMNIGNANLTVSALAFTTGTKFLWRPGPGFALPMVLQPKTPTKINVWFAPQVGDEDVLLSDTLTITSDNDGGAVTVAVRGWGRAIGAQRLTFSPSAWDFDWVVSRDQSAGISIGDSSDTLMLGVYNSGDQPLTIQGINVMYPVDFVGSPAMFPAVLAPGAGILIPLDITPVSAGQVKYTDLVEIICDAAYSPYIPKVSVTGVAISSSYDLSAWPSNTPLSLVAIDKYLKSFAPTNLVTEEDAVLRRLHNFGTPNIEKTLLGVWFRYEDLGSATVNVQAKTKSGTTVNSKNKDVIIGTIDADSWIQTIFASLQVEGELIELQFKVVANNGPVSITDYTPHYDDWSELSAFENLPAVSSAYSVSATFEVLFAIDSKLYTMTDMTNLNCEEPASFSMQRNLQLAGVEKTVASLLIKYEDLGTQATVKLTVTPKNGRTVAGPIALVLPTYSSDRTVRPAEFDLQISDELLVFLFTRDANSGPLSIVEIGPNYDDRGRTKAVN